MAGPIRQPIDLDAFSNYLAQHAPQIKTPIDVKQFGYGQSNPTYLLTDKTGSKYVMRKKPPGKLLSKSAHRVDREYRILHALEKTDVAVPKTYGLCEDDKVVGTPFYIMEFLDGRIFEDPSMPGISEKDRREMWHDAVRTLAKFHRLSPASVNLSNFGKHEGFYDRQLSLFSQLSVFQAQAKDVDTKKAVGPIPHFEQMTEFFSESSTQPKDRGTFIHGDYKIDNLVFHKTEPRVIGILDWEMSTIGHPLSDISNLLQPYTLADNETAKTVGTGTAGASNPAFRRESRVPGLPSQDECLEWYAEVAGWGYPPNESAWGEAFTVYRNAIIMQGIAARHAVRQASSARASEYGAAMAPFGEVAWQLTEEAMRKAGGKAKL